MFQSTPQTPTSGQDGVTGTRFTLLPQQPGKNTAQSIRNGFKDNEHQARMVILERQETNMDNPSTAPADCLESLQTTGTQRGNSGRIQAEFRQLGSLRRFELSLEKPRELEIRGKICTETDLQRSAGGPCNTVKNI